MYIRLVFIIALIVTSPVLNCYVLSSWGGIVGGKIPVDVMQVDGGTSFTLALLENGSLCAWGSNINKQCEVPSGYDFTQISAGDNHCLALRSNGSIVAWGDNSEGQCNVPIGECFTEVSAGEEFSLALKSDGSIVAWGDNWWGQCDVPPGIGFQSISAGSQNGLAIKADSSLVAWGISGWGQLNVPQCREFIKISAGRRHSIALRSDGIILVWGANDYGQGVAVSGNNFVEISAGDNHNVALKSDGSAIVWGGNNNGQTNIPLVTECKHIAAGGGHSIAIKTDDSLFLWGSNVHWQCGVAQDSFQTLDSGAVANLGILKDGSLKAIGGYYFTLPAGNDFVSVATSGDHGLALKQDGTLCAFGNNDYGQCDIPTGVKFSAATCGMQYSIAILSDSSLAAWGSTSNDLCNVPPGNDYVAIAAGGFHALALRADGSIVGWGSNNYGVCDVPAGTYRAISAGVSHSAAIRSDGSITVWGDNYYGQCEAPEGNCYTSIDCGYWHTVALKYDGTVVSWGNSVTNAIQPMNQTCQAISASAFSCLGFVREDSDPHVSYPALSCELTTDNAVNLKWQMLNVSNLVGFNIYRSMNYTYNNVIKLNHCLIPVTDPTGDHIYHFYDDTVEASTLYFYWIEMLTTNNIHVTVGPVFANTLAEPAQSPEYITKLYSACPNPFKQQTDLPYCIKNAGIIMIDIYNIRGQKVRSFRTQHNKAGFYKITWDSNDDHGKIVPSGIYFSKLIFSGKVITSKMVMLK